MIAGRRLTLGLVALLAIGTVAGFLDRLSWIFEPADVFRVQYAAAAALVALLALVGRSIRVAVAAAVTAALNLAVVAPWHGIGNPPVPAGSPTVRIVAFNVDASNHRYRELGPLLARLEPEIVGLTEVTPEWAAAAREVRGLVPRRLVPERGAYGIALLSTAQPESVRVARFPGSGPPVVAARFRIDGRPLTFVLVHLHTPFAGSVHVRELNALARARPRLGRRLVVCGDFNTVPWSAQLGDFAASTGLRDAFAGSWPSYSWPSWSPLLRVPIDHCLVSDGIAVLGRRYGPSGGSDHFPVVVDLALVPFRARPAARSPHGSGLAAVRRTVGGQR